MTKLVTITGPIATGATTLASSLVKLMPWETVLEADVETTHPFFGLYHVDPTRYTFHNQVMFLIRSAEAHQRFKQRGNRGKIFVQDFTPFEHTEVYAYVQHALGRLSDAEYEALLRLTKILESTYQQPEVLVYRPLRRESLLQRVQQRGRPSEQGIDVPFLEAIRVRFEDWATTWTRSAIIRVDEDLDVLTDAPGVRSVAAAIAEYL